jgi:uncharacterized protein (TIGR02217 family)
MSNSYDPVLLPPGYAYGFTGGPSFDTRIHTMDGYGEQRVQVVDEPKWKWQAVRKNFREDADVDALLRWFLARRGALYGFLFLDPRDFSTAENGRDPPSMLDQIIGYGDGVTTRFRLRKQYSDPGGMTARAFPRRVVPLTGVASAAVASVIDVEVGASIAPTAAVDGVVDGGATFLQDSLEVELSSAPGIGAQVTWGGYFATPVRFDETTDKQFDAVMAGFQADQAAFGVESIQFDDPVPMAPGGSPYGVQSYPTETGGIEVRRYAFLFDYGGAGCAAYLPDLDQYPTGGPHHVFVNAGAGNIIVRDAFGNTVGTVTTTTKRWLFVREDSSGVRTPYLL